MAGPSQSPVAAAQAAVTKYEATPTSVALPPLKAKPSSGKLIIFLNPGSAQTSLAGAGISAAANAVGWRYRQIVFDQSNPSSLVAALKQALLYHPAAVSLLGSPYSQFESVIPQYQAAHVLLIPAESVYPSNTTMPATIQGASMFSTAAEQLAAWVTADSGGTAHVLVVGADALSGLQLMRTSFTTDLAKDCPGCTTTSIQIPLDQGLTGQANPLVVTAVQRNPSVNYVVEVDGAFFPGLSTSLASADLKSRVKIASAFGDNLNQSAVKAGSESVTTDFPGEIAGWLVVDAVLRNLEGMSYPSGYGTLQSQLLVKDGSWTVTNNYAEPANYADLFKAIWKVQ
jgi:ribose transport system substrate-binding protein